MTARPYRAAGAAIALLLAVWSSPTPATAETLAGKLLVAAPSMPDGYFAHSVVYMLRHDETGAMGVVVNIPMGDLPIASIFEGLGIELAPDHALSDEPVRVYSGGPVDAAHGFILHSDEDSGEDTLAAAGGLALSMSVELMRAIAAGQGPKHSLLLFGYAGWGPGQLEQEMKRDDWVAVPADDSLVFDSDDGTKWQRSLDSFEVDL